MTDVSLATHALTDAADGNRYRVYVVQLAWRALQIDTNRRTSPTGLPYLYVGSTWLTPEGRFARHRAGGFGTSSKVRNFGLGLRPDLYLHLPPVADEYQARTLEASWAEELADIGFTTRSDGVLRRPKANVIHPLSDIAAEVEDLFDQVVFSIRARRPAIDCEGIAAEIARVNAPDASWERIGRFAHVAQMAITSRVGWLQKRGFLDIAARVSVVRDSDAGSCVQP